MTDLSKERRDAIREDALTHKIDRPFAIVGVDAGELLALLDALDEAEEKLDGFERTVDEAWEHTRDALEDSHVAAAVLAEREACAAWHDQRALDTPDAFEMEFHQVSAAALRARGDKPHG